MDNKQILRLPINFIDDPADPMRSNVYDDQLHDLAESIKNVGLIQPITVRKKGERYEVISGHRRLAAHRLLSKEFIDAIVIDADDKSADALKVHENLFREDVNPVDQAIFLSHYIKSNNLTIAEVSQILNRSESWVRGRLNLLDYPDYLIGYIREGKLSLEAASYLNQIKNPALRRDYSRIAALQGLNANRAMYWMKQAEVNKLPSNPAEAPDVPPDQLRDDSPLLVQCSLCGEKGNIMEMENVFVHPQCLEEYQKILENLASQAGDAETKAVDEVKQE
jgi:ParB family chromosome partitioning protein